MEAQQQEQFSDELPADIKAAIIEKLDFYFSDDNLKTDAHLLAKLIESGGRVEIREVHGWYSNRSIYKNANAKWKAAVNESTVVQVVDKKYLQRRVPFDMAKAEVKPVANQGRESTQQDKDEQKIQATLAANPHLTRGMLKATGFERNIADNPLSLEERERNARDYDPALPITLRIENAIVRYRAVRKMHQETLSLFEAFLSYCGLENRANAFTGGVSKTEEEELTKDELAFRKQTNFVQEDVVESLQAGDGKWVVDFETVMKGFFSTRFMTKFDWQIEAVVEASCNVLRNFYRYLRRNEVCPEYKDQIEATLKTIDLAEVEYKMLAKAESVLPGLFNIACSTLKGGTWANVHYKGDWQTAEEAASSSQGLNDDDAKYIFMAGIAAFATEEQASNAKMLGHAFEIKNMEEYIGMEITGIQCLKDCPKQAQDFFEQDNIKDTVVPKMGKLFCKRYTFPQANPVDVPEDLPPGYDTFEFIMDEKALSGLFVGMKMEATVKELGIGFCWLDHIATIYPSFFQWCWNEKIRDYKKPGPPKDWMLRINDKLSKPAPVPYRKRLTNGGIENAKAGTNGGGEKEAVDHSVDDSQADDDWLKKAATKYFANRGVSEEAAAGADQPEASSAVTTGNEPRITVDDLIFDDETSEVGSNATPGIPDLASGRYWQGDGFDDSGSLNEYLSDEEFDDAEDEDEDREGIEDGLANLGLVVQADAGEDSVEGGEGTSHGQGYGQGLPTFRFTEAS